MSLTVDADAVEPLFSNDAVAIKVMALTKGRLVVVWISAPGETAPNPFGIGEINVDGGSDFFLFHSQVFRLCIQFFLSV